MQIPNLQNLLKIDFDKNKKQILIFAGLVAILVLILYVNFILTPQVMRVVNVIVKMNKMGFELKSAKEEIVKIPKYKSDIEAFKEKVENYEKMLPAEQEIPSLLESLSSMAKSSGVRIESIMPIVKKDDKNSSSQVYQEIPILITGKSGYHELGNFVSKLEGGERFMKIVDINIKAGKLTPKRHDVEILVLTYILVKGK